MGLEYTINDSEEINGITHIKDMTIRSYSLNITGNLKTKLFECIADILLDIFDEERNQGIIRNDIRIELARELFDILRGEEKASPPLPYVYRP